MYLAWGNNDTFDETHIKSRHWFTAKEQCEITGYQKNSI